MTRIWQRLRHAISVRTGAIFGLSSRWRPRAARPPPSIIEGGLDQPAQDELSFGVVRVSGWAISRAGPIAHIEARLDEQRLGDILYGWPRPDVVAARPDVHEPACGYYAEFYLEQRGVIGGRQLFTLNIKDTAGNKRAYERWLMLRPPTQAELAESHQSVELDIDSLLARLQAEIEPRAPAPVPERSAAVAPAAEDMPGTAPAPARAIGWRSVARSAAGYANHSRQMMAALERQGVELAYQYLFGPREPDSIPRTEAAEQVLLRRLEARSIDGPRTQIVVAQGDLLTQNTGRYRIGYTMHESDRLPAEWVRQANVMQEVWVPSTFCRDVFQNSGVRVPVYIVPGGVDRRYFHPEVPCHPSRQTYVFLTTFEWGVRKAPELLLKAFNEEFTAKEPVVLLVRTANRDPQTNVAAAVRQLHLRPGGGRLILSVNEVLPYYQTGALYRSADCFVLPSHGEGWGLPILEAMACGLPAIATAWSGPRDFMDETNSYPVRVECLAPAAAGHPYFEGSHWAQPSYEHLRQLMRYVYEHPAEGRAKGMAAAQDARTKWTWDAAARIAAARLAEIEDS